MAAPTEQDQTNWETKVDQAWKTHPDLDLVRNFVKTIRDCEFYKDEHKDCSSWRGRFRQRYVYGESLDCQDFDLAYKYCKMAKETGDEKALDFVVQYELSKRNFRIDCASANNVWEYRKKPPKSWAYPGVERDTIPDDDDDDESHTTAIKSVQERQIDSNASAKTDDPLTLIEQGNTNNDKKSSSGCVIS